MVFEEGTHGTAAKPKLQQLATLELQELPPELADFESLFTLLASLLPTTF